MDQKLYLSAYMDLYSSEIMSYSISSHPTLDMAINPLKELLNMNMIKFISIPGIISAIGLIIIMLPQDAGDWVQVIQLKSLVAMSFIVLSYTVLSKNRFSFMDAA